MPDIRGEFNSREIPIAPKTELEKVPEKAPEPSPEGRPAVMPNVTPAPVLPQISDTPQAPVFGPVSPIQKQIETILQDDLLELYKELSPAEQQKFKVRGEEVANQISQMVRSIKVRVQDIIKLIMDWLKMLPGVKSYFVEQEAKIKAEKILKIKK